MGTGFAADADDIRSGLVPGPEGFTGTELALSSRGSCYGAGTTTGSKRHYYHSHSVARACVPQCGRLGTFSGFSVKEKKDFLKGEHGGGFTVQIQTERLT